jgi:hypothetical protein
MEDYGMENRPVVEIERKKAWSKPAMAYDGELSDFVQGTNKPTNILGEPGDPGHKPSGGGG